MGKKLYVGNLSYDTSNDTLQEMFEAFGTVQSAQIIMDRETGRSKGFGFVEMGSDQEAQAAINGLNGKESGGRALTVNEARPREDRGGRRWRSWRFRRRRRTLWRRRAVWRRRWWWPRRLRRRTLLGRLWTRERPVARPGGLLPKRKRGHKVFVEASRSGTVYGAMPNDGDAALTRRGAGGTSLEKDPASISRRERPAIGGRRRFRCRPRDTRRLPGDSTPSGRSPEMPP